MHDEWKEAFEQEARNTLEQWQKHKFRSESDDLLFLILKGHLLIEEKLDAIIAIHFGDEKLSKALNLRFQQKARLAEAICTQYFNNSWWDPFLWPAIQLLNNVRNELAHKLESEKIREHVARLIRLYVELGKLHETSFITQTGETLPRLPDSLLTNDIRLRSLIINVLQLLDNLTVGLVALDKVVVAAIVADGAKAMSEAMDWMSSIQAKLRVELLLAGIASSSETSGSEDVPAAI